MKLLILFGIIFTGWMLTREPEPKPKETKFTTKGTILTKPDSMEWRGGYYRHWDSYCPIVNRKPKNYGKRRL